MDDSAEHAAPWLRDVIARTRPRLTRFAARLLGRDRGEDAVQDAFAKLCEADRRDLEGREAEWLFTVCRHRAVDLRRQDRVRARADAPADEAAVRPDDALALARTLQRLRALVDALPRRQQEAVRLRFDEGLSYEEIHARTGWSVSYVGWLLHVVMRALREGMEAHDGP